MIFHSIYKKPILIVGNGVRESGATEALQEFYKKTKIPVLTTMNAVDLMQDKDRLGFIGVYGNRVANLIVQEADLVIAVGARLGLRQIGNKPEYFAPKAKLIRIDIDQYELSRYIKEDEEKCLMDAKDFFISLLQQKIPSYEDWNKKCFAAKSILNSCDREIGNLCIEKIAELLPIDPIIAVDVGQNQCWSAQSLNIKGKKGRILIGGGYGSMGCGLPYAIGASYATNKGNVYCITGDGGLQMNIQEFQAIVSQELPIKIFVINNKALGKITEIQTGSYNSRYLITNAQGGYTIPDFTKVAKAYGMRAITLDSYKELDKHTEWIYDNEPCLFNISLPEDTLLIPKMNWNQKEMLPNIDEAVFTKAQSLLH